MDTSNVQRLEDEIQRLRRECLIQRVVLLGCVLSITMLVGLYCANPRSVLASTTDRDGNLHVRGLIVEDQSGHERVRLGAPLPDPIIHGVRYKRQGMISGLNISDSEGNEACGFRSRLSGW